MVVCFPGRDGGLLGARNVLRVELGGWLGWPGWLFNGRRSIPAWPAIYHAGWTDDKDTSLLGISLRHPRLSD